MWDLSEPTPVKLIIGILACDEQSLVAAADALISNFGLADFTSEIFPFDKTEYYKDQTGPNILRQFITIDKLIEAGQLAQIKHKTNLLEQQLADSLNTTYPRPVNLDPGYLEPSKLILASTKNFSHRIYIGDNMYAEVTLTFVRDKWHDHEYTFPDYKTPTYHEFLSQARNKLVEQLRNLKKQKQGTQQTEARQRKLPDKTND